MVKLFNSESGAPLGEISEEGLAFLAAQLEEESLEDRDYYFTGATVDLIEMRGASAELVKVLRAAVGDTEGIEIRWQRSESA